LDRREEEVVPFQTFLHTVVNIVDLTTYQQDQEAVGEKRREHRTLRYCNFTPSR
jgi:S-methylmethionine-dependent homocysteine/selenocysteine methylase